MTDRERDIEQFSASLGPRLRELRKQRGLTLRELAGRAGVSASLLSDIERGRVNPSVASFFSLANQLGVAPHGFFPGGQPTLRHDLQSLAAGAADPRVASEPADTARPPEEVSSVVRASERAEIPLVGGIRWQRLTPAPEGAVEFIEMRYEPGASSGEAMHHHPGREFGLVLEGELTLELGFQRYRLSRGDSVAFDSTTPHRLSNQTEALLRLAWVNINTPRPSPHARRPGSGGREPAESD